MNSEERQYHVSRILYCQGTFDWRGRVIIIENPTALIRMRAHKVYQDALAQCDGCLKNEHLCSWMIKMGYWDEASENKIVSLKQDTENLKLQMLAAISQSDTRERYRKMLRAAEAEIERLENIKYAHASLTAESIAFRAKLAFVMGHCLKYEDGSPVLKSNFWNRPPTNIIDAAIMAISDIRLDERGIRELAKNDPWISIWSAAEYCNGIFGGSAADLNEEQRALIMWSRAYDSVKGAEDMTTEIMMDDDLFDGWLIKSHKASQIDEDHKWFQSKITNPKVANSEHIFVMAETPEDIARINRINDVGGKIAKQSLFRDITQKEVTRETETSIAKQKLIEKYHGK